MTDILESPPNYEEIIKRFPKVAGLNVLFAWGFDIYNPKKVRIPNVLRAHETMHGRRQLLYTSKIYGDGVEGWWAQYLKDPRFRRKEEVVAHRVEYLAGMEGTDANRHTRRALLKITAKRLANPMYDMGITRSNAMVMLRDNPA